MHLHVSHFSVPTDGLDAALKTYICNNHLKTHLWICFCIHISICIHLNPFHINPLYLREDSCKIGGCCSFVEIDVLHCMYSFALYCIVICIYHCIYHREDSCKIGVCCSVALHAALLRCCMQSLPMTLRFIEWICVFPALLLWNKILSLFLYWFIVVYDIEIACKELHWVYMATEEFVESWSCNPSFGLKVKLSPWKIHSRRSWNDNLKVGLAVCFCTNDDQHCKIFSILNIRS